MASIAMTFVDRFLHQRATSEMFKNYSPSSFLLLFNVAKFIYLKKLRRYPNISGLALENAHTDTFFTIQESWELLFWIQGLRNICLSYPRLSTDIMSEMEHHKLFYGIWDSNPWRLTHESFKLERDLWNRGWKTQTGLSRATTMAVWPNAVKVNHPFLDVLPCLL